MTIQFYLILRHDQFTSMNIVLKYFKGINHIAPISVLACKYHIQPYLTFPDSKGKLKSNTEAKERLRQTFGSYS